MVKSRLTKGDPVSTTGEVDGSDTVLIEIFVKLVVG